MRFTVEEMVDISADATARALMEEHVGVDFAAGADRTVVHTYDPSEVSFNIVGVRCPSTSELLLRAMDAAMTGLKKALTAFFEPLLGSVPVRVDFGVHGHRWGRRRLRRERRRRIAENRERRRAVARKGKASP